MKNIFYSDYLLGYQIHPSNDFFANFPSVINSLNNFEFKKDSLGNLMFPFRNEDTEHFIKMSQDPAVGNLIIILKDYIKSPQNFVVKGSNNLDCFTYEFCGYIRHEPIRDKDGVYFSDSFVKISKEENIIVIVSVYKDLTMSYFRSGYHVMNISNHFAKVLKIASKCSKHTKDPIVDKVSKKYVRRFTSSPYFLVK